jgi:ArsR family transcriptional regulator
MKTVVDHFGPDQPDDGEEGVCGLYIAQELGISPMSTSVLLKVLTQDGLIRPLRIAAPTAL